MRYEVKAEGRQCPIPVVMTKEVLEKASAGDEVHVYVDNETAVNNLSRLAKTKDCTFVSEKLEEKRYLIRIGVNADGIALKSENGDGTGVFCEKSSNIQKGNVVVVSSDKMGEGDEKLGEILIKGFLYALSQLDRLPETLLFYNGGAKLTAEGSESLEDLRNMEEEGVEILTCGTCLKYYSLEEKLCVGKVTDMYTIAEKMSGAEKIIRP